MTEISTEFVWNELKKEIFAVMGMVTGKGQSRTVGIVYVAHDRKIYIATGKDSWKARHTRSNSNVSITVPIAKRIPLLPWIKIPAATITFSGKASVLEPAQIEKNVLFALLRGLVEDKERLATMCVIEIEPIGDFITYGVGVRMMDMREADKARGRAPVFKNHQ